MEHLVLSANGRLGSNLVASGLERGWRVAGTCRRNEPDFEYPLVRLGVTDDEAVEDILGDTDPDLVINCAAMTDVDVCEADLDRAYAVNADASGMLAALAADVSAQVFHVSTDYVFNGCGDTSYGEDADTNPIQEYGAPKLVGERALRENASSALIARFSFVYGVHQDTGELSGFPAWVPGRL